MAKKAAQNATVLLEPNTLATTKAVESAPIESSVTEETTNEVQSTPEVVERAAFNVIIEAPMGHCELGYVTNHIDFQGMTPRQRAAAKRLMMSLDAANERVEMSGVRYNKGKVVHDYGDSIRWLYERLADAWEAETGLDITKGLTF